MKKTKQFLKKHNIEISFKRYAIDALGGMALGLFCSLLIGTIINTLGDILSLEILNEIGSLAQSVSGAAMAVAIGWALKAPSLVVFSLVAVGYIANGLGGAGGPLAVLVVALIACEAGKALSGLSRIDIIVVPLGVVLIGAGVSYLCAPGLGALANGFGRVIIKATELQPFWMGVVIAVLVGVALTLPISSAAICAALGLSGLAGGAALAGCCCQMIGFAVISFKENRWAGFLSQGLGTSMLQMKNIVKNPKIWIPPILASAIIGPIATCVFHLEMNGPAIASGMGTSGLVGPIGVYLGWVDGARQISAFDWAGLICICFILPAILSLFFAKISYLLGWVKKGDLAL